MPSPSAADQATGLHKQPPTNSNSKEGLRWAVVHAYERGFTRYRQIAAETGTTPTFAARWLRRWQKTGNVKALRSRGRPKRLTSQQLAWAVQFAEQNEVYSSNTVAAALQQQFSIQVSRATVNRALSSLGLQYRYLATAPLLTEANKAARLQFAQANARRAWKGVMFTDSKYFYTHPVKKGRGVKVWHKPSPSKVQRLPKHATGIHVYMGVTCFGVTRLIFVTGTAGQTSKFVDKKGKALKGVGGQEYVEEVLPVLLEDGQRLFSHHAHWSEHWTFQQDGAPAHRVAAVAEKVNSVVSGRLLLHWPPNSPDLSWIENVWAWMEQQLRRQPVCNNVQELKAAVQAIKDRIPASMLNNCVSGMAARLQKVIELNGSHIGR